MDQKRWAKVENLLQEALEQPTATREAYVRQAAGDDGALADEVLSLLAQGKGGSAFLEPPPAPASPRLEAGHLLGPYTIKSLIGEGGMGQVYRARDGRLDRDVAIKVLPPEVSASADRRARFEREARTVGALSHPNIVAVHDVGAVGPVTFLVMELLEGETLRARLNQLRPSPTPGGAMPTPSDPASSPSGSGAKTPRRRLPVQKALDIAAQIAQGLAAAHARGIVHRDLKPENIFLTTDGRVKVLDFGLARAVAPPIPATATRTTHTEAGPTQPGTVLGTIGYMAPEQVRGQEADSRADIFALGAVLYEMLTGARAFAADSAVETMSAILNTDPLERRDLSAGLPAAVEGVMRHCLEKQPDERFQSARDLAFQLQALSGIPSNTSTLPVRRRRWTPVAVGVALLASTTVALWGWLRPPPSAPTDVVYLPIAIDDRERAEWGPSVRISPDGTRLAYSVGASWRLVDLRTGAKSDLPEGVRGLGLAFSRRRDTAAVSFGASVQRLEVVDLATGQRQPLVECCGGPFDWDVDGWIYHRDRQHNLVRTNVDGRREVIETAAAGTWGSRLAVRAPSGVILYTRPHTGTVAQRRAEIVAFDPARGRRQSLGNYVQAFPAGTDRLLLLRADGTLFASGFDREALALSGPMVSALTGIEMLLGSDEVPVGSVSVSDDGTLVYVTAQPANEDEVLIVGRDGVQRGPSMTWGGWVGAVAASADGRWVASVSVNRERYNLFSRTTGDATSRRLTYVDNLAHSQRFVGGSDRITFIASTQGRNWDLYEMPAAGGTEPKLLLDRDLDIRTPRLTPDGRSVVFVELSAQGVSEIRVHDFESSRTQDLVTAPKSGVSPSVSPDGKWLLFQSADSGRNEIYVRSFSDSGIGWQLTADGGSMPEWSSSGREVYYLNANGEVASIPVSLKPMFSSGPPRMLFRVLEHTRWSGRILPGDAGFILVRRNLKATGQVLMIRNFFELLRQKVGR